MPVRNGLPYLIETVESVLDQTFVDFELLIVDDHSEDDSFGMLASHARADRRIKLLKNEGAPGIFETRNTGLRMARGEFVTNQDSDDLSAPDRLAKQIEFLRDKPRISLVGTFIRMMGPDGQRLQLHREPIGSDAVLFHSQIGTPFAGATVMWRNEAFRQYGLEYCNTAAEDYDLWARALAAGLQGDNIAEELYFYRLHQKSFTHLNSAANANAADEVSRSQIQRLTGASLAQAYCEPRFRELVHALLTGNPFQWSSGDRPHLADAKELLLLNRLNGSISAEGYCRLASLFAAADQHQYSTDASVHCPVWSASDDDKCLGGA